jgi:hypothetical protein
MRHILNRCFFPVVDVVVVLFNFQVNWVVLSWNMQRSVWSQRTTNDDERKNNHIIYDGAFIWTRRCCGVWRRSSAADEEAAAAETTTTERRKRKFYHLQANNSVSDSFWNCRQEEVNDTWAWLYLHFSLQLSFLIFHFLRRAPHPSCNNESCCNCVI